MKYYIFDYINFWLDDNIDYIILNVDEIATTRKYKFIADNYRNCIMGAKL